MSDLAIIDGGISLAEEHFRQQLAACAMGLEFLRASSGDDALARIWKDAPPPPEAVGEEYSLAELAQLRPLVVVSTADREGYRSRRMATGTYAEAGQLLVQFEREVPADCKWDTQFNLQSFKRELGIWKRQWEALSGEAGYLEINSSSLLTLFQNDPNLESSQGNFLFALWRIDWGIG